MQLKILLRIGDVYDLHAYMTFFSGKYVKLWWHKNNNNRKTCLNCQSHTYIQDVNLLILEFENALVPKSAGPLASAKHKDKIFQNIHLSMIMNIFYY